MLTDGVVVSVVCVGYEGRKIGMAGWVLRYAVAQLVEALRWFNSRWGHWGFSLIRCFWPNYGPEVDSASNRYEYQGGLLGGKGGRCVGLTTLLPSCAV